MKTLFVYSLFTIFVLLGCSGLNDHSGEIRIETNMEYSIFPRPRNPLVINNDKVGFYNDGNKSFLVFSIETGKPLMKRELKEFPLSEMYEMLTEYYDNEIVLTPFDSLYGGDLSDLRSFTSYGLYKTIDNQYFTIIKVPYEYKDTNFFHDGQYYNATIRKSNFFLLILDETLNLTRYYLINSKGLPENIAFYFHSQLIFTGESLIAPFVMTPDVFEGFGREIPAYGQLSLEDDELIVKNVITTSNKNWFRPLGNVAVINSFYPSLYKNDSYAIALGNQIFKLNSNFEVEEKALFEYPECERISYIHFHKNRLFYICGDLIFEKNMLPDSLIKIKSSNGKTIARFDALLTVQPFYDNNCVYLFETSDNFLETKLKYYQLD